MINFPWIIINVTKWCLMLHLRVDDIVIVKVALALVGRLDGHERADEERHASVTVQLFEFFHKAFNLCAIGERHQMATVVRTTECALSERHGRDRLGNNLQTSLCLWNDTTNECGKVQRLVTLLQN